MFVDSFEGDFAADKRLQRQIVIGRIKNVEALLEEVAETGCIMPPQTMTKGETNVTEAASIRIMFTNRQFSRLGHQAIHHIGSLMLMWTENRDVIGFMLVGVMGEQSKTGVEAIPSDGIVYPPRIKIGLADWFVEEQDRKLGAKKTAVFLNHSGSQRPTLIYVRHPSKILVYLFKV